MPKLVKQPVTLESLSGTIDHLANVVEKGFLDVRSELSKKADKADIKGLQGDIESLQSDIGRLANATKLGFDEVDKQFEKVDDRFDKVDHKLGNLDNRLDIFVTHEKRLVKVERELGFAV